MKTLYKHLQKGEPPAQALRSAQLEMIKDGQPPFYWAPFVIIGG